MGKAILITVVTVIIISTPSLAQTCPEGKVQLELQVPKPRTVWSFWKLYDGRLRYRQFLAQVTWLDRSSVIFTRMPAGKPFCAPSSRSLEQESNRLYRRDAAASSSGRAGSQQQVHIQELQGELRRALSRAERAENENREIKAQADLTQGQVDSLDQALKEASVRIDSFTQVLESRSTSDRLELAKNIALVVLLLFAILFCWWALRERKRRVVSESYVNQLFQDVTNDVAPIKVEAISYQDKVDIIRADRLARRGKMLEENLRPAPVGEYLFEYQDPLTKKWYTLPWYFFKREGDVVYIPHVAAPVPVSSIPQTLRSHKDILRNILPLRWEPRTIPNGDKPHTKPSQEVNEKREGTSV